MLFVLETVNPGSGGLSETLASRRKDRAKDVLSGRALEVFSRQGFLLCQSGRSDVY